MPARKDITGQRFGRMVAIKYVGSRKYLWRCDCGGTREYIAWPIKAGLIKSCGCQANTHKIKHGHRIGRAMPKTYAVWQSMWQRCTDKNLKAYPRYGGRGITVCDRWKDYSAFLADMGEAPDGLQIERIDNDAGYSPENCKWATVKEQSINRSTTHWITFNGQTLSVGQWADQLGLERGTIHRRLRLGYSLADVLSSASLPRGRSCKLQTPAPGVHQAGQQTVRSRTACDS